MIRPTPIKPTSWVDAKLEDLSKGLSTTGKKVRTKDALPVGRYPVVDQGTLACAGYLNDESLLVAASPKEPVILFGDHTRIVKFIEYPFIPGADGTKLLQPKARISPRYFYYLLKAVDIPARGYGRHFGYLSSVDLSLAPELEQQRIADKLDTVLTRVDAVNTRLARVAPLLKRFRQSVLAAAISGRLTEDWRNSAGIRSVWLTTDVQSVSQVGTGSTPLRSNPAFFSSAGTPWITSAATSSEIVTEANEYVTPEAIAAHRLKVFPVGTLLVAMYGEGKTRGQVTQLGIPATINQACAAVVVDESKMLRDFVKLALQANYLEMRVLAEGGNQPNLNLAKVKGFPLPLPSRKEQTEIVRRVETLFAFADRLEARLQAAQTAADRLTPSLLAKAFRGELVPQDPNDEPASELLKCLAATSAQSPAPKLGRRKATPD